MSLDPDLSNAPNYSDFDQALENSMDSKHEAFLGYLKGVVRKIGEITPNYRLELKGLLEKAGIQGAKGQNKVNNSALGILLGLTYMPSEKQKLNALLEPHLISFPVDPSLANLKAYIQVLNNIPAEMITSEIKENLLLAFQNVSNDYQRDTLLKNLQEMPALEMMDKLDVSKKLSANIEDTYQRIAITEAMLKLPCKENEDLKPFIAFCSTFNNGHDRADVIKEARIFGGRPIQEWLPLLLAAYKVGDNGREIVGLMRAIRNSLEMPLLEIQKNEIALQVIKSLSGISGAFQKTLVLEAVNQIPNELMDEAMDLMLPKLQSQTSGYEAAAIVRHTFAILKKQAEEIAKLKT